MGIASLASALVLASVCPLFAQSSAEKQQAAENALKDWDPGVGKDLFKDGKDGKGNPTHRINTECKDCAAEAQKLQAALDKWYTAQAAAGAKLSSDGQKNSDFSEGSVQQHTGKTLVENALGGLGQPADKGAAAKKKTPLDAKAKAALKTEIKELAKALKDCLDKKCPPKEEGKTTDGPGPKAGEPKIGEDGSGPTDGQQPGGGQPPPANLQLPTLPKLPDCWKDAAQKKKFFEDLDAAEQELLKLRRKYNPKAGGILDDDAVAAINKELNKINDLKAQAANVKDCPKTKAMLPKETTEEFCALINDDKIDIDFTGTGETCGHVADAKVTNRTDQPVSCVIPAMVLESISGKNQDYACPESKPVDVGPKESKTVPINGVCLVRNKPPVGKDVAGDLRINGCAGSRIANDHADKFLAVTTAIFRAADELLKDGALKDIPYKDPERKKEIVTQWATWMDPRISEMTNVPRAKKDDLKKVVYKQIEEQGPMSAETKKKIDEGINTIFEKVELTTAKAKDLEKQEETPEEGSTIDDGGIGQPEFVGQTQAKKPTPTPAKPKPGGGKTGTKEKTTPTPKPVEPKKEEPKGGGTTEDVPVTEEKPKMPDATAIPSYPFTKETDCGTITISVGESGELVFDFKPKKPPGPKCPCKEFGWIQHISPAEGENWRYDNGVLPGVATAKKIGAKSDPSLPKQPVTPPKGTKLADWDKNPWYGGTTDKSKPKDFGENPTPQTHISDKPDAPNVKFVTQLVCIPTGEVLFTWKWGPFTSGQEAVDKVPGEAGPPP